MKIQEFRSWNKTTKKFVYGKLTKEGFTISVDPNSPLGENDLSDWQRFFGLKDKNGKKIFEGDILKQRAGIVGEVIWRDGCFYWCDNLLLGEFRMGLIEVIGNTYENGQLLK